MNKRREEILREIPIVDVAVDVGCDHGYVGIECLKRGKAKEVIFADISEPSLQKAKTNLASHENLQKRGSFVCTNGLLGIETARVGACIIAGMGGEEIIKILSESTPACCILQPMSEVEKLREFLQERYEIKTDRLFLDRGKYYNLIVVEKTGKKEELTKFEILFGKTNLLSPSKDFLIYASNRLERQREIEKKRSTPCEEDGEIIGFLSQITTAK